MLLQETSAMDERRGLLSHIDGEVRALCESGRFDDATTLTIRGYGPAVLGYLRVLHDDDDAADVFSAFAERLWRAFPSFQWRCALQTWVYLIARRESLRFRKRGAHQLRREPNVELEKLPAHLRTETASILHTEKRKRLLALRDELAREDQELLVLRLDRRMSWADVAMTLLDDPDADTETLRRESARLRKRFQALKERLVTLGREKGFLPSPDDE